MMLRNQRLKTINACVLLVVLLLSSMTMAGFPVKSQNPLALMAALPEQHTPRFDKTSRWSYRTLLTLSNHWYFNRDKSEKLWIDTESVVMFNRLSFYQDTFQFYIDLPYIRYGGGFLDEFLSNYHQWLDLPNGDRHKYAQRQNRITYEHDGTTVITPESGFQDPVLGFGWLFFENKQSRHAFYSRLKFDVVSSEKLRGNGAVTSSHFFSHEMAEGSWQGNLQYGVMFQSKHQFLGWKNQPWVSVASITFSYWINPVRRAGVQYDYHSALYRDVTVTPAGESHMGSLGIVWQTKRHQWHWVIQEDLLVGSAADVSFQVGYERLF